MDVRDTVAGIALLYDRQDEYSARLVRAMEADDLDEMEHVSALMICTLYSRDDVEAARFASKRWTETFVR